MFKWLLGKKDDDVNGVVRKRKVEEDSEESASETEAEEANQRSRNRRGRAQRVCSKNSALHTCT